MVEVEIVDRGNKKVRNFINTKHEPVKLPFFKRNTIADEAGRLDAQWLDIKDSHFLICLIKFTFNVAVTFRIGARRNLIFVPIVLSGHLNIYSENEEQFDLVSLQYYLLTIRKGESIRAKNNSEKGFLFVLVFEKDYFEGMEGYYNSAQRIINEDFHAGTGSFLIMDVSLQHILKYIFSLITTNTKPDYFKLAASVQTAMAMILSEIDKSFAREVSYPWLIEWQMESVKRVQKHLEENYEQFPRMDVLLKLAGMNETTFRKIFMEITGNNAYEYWNSNRMELAWNWLISKKYKPLQVAGLLGFSTSQAFNKPFKKHFGIPPALVYRKRK